MQGCMKWGRMSPPAILHLVAISKSCSSVLSGGNARRVRARFLKVCVSFLLQLLPSMCLFASGLKHVGGFLFRLLS